jgi:hypothetical protein
VDLRWRPLLSLRQFLPKLREDRLEVACDDLRGVGLAPIEDDLQGCGFLRIEVLGEKIVNRDDSESFLLIDIGGDLLV